MPVGDFGFTHLPAEQDDLLVDLAGKVQQADVKVLDLDANCVDLFHRILSALNVRVQLGALTPDLANVDMHAARDEAALVQPLQVLIDLLGSMLGFDGALQQRLQHQNQRLSFVKGKELHDVTSSLLSLNLNLQHTIQ